MLQSLREDTEGELQMLLSPRKNGLTSLFKEVRVFARFVHRPWKSVYQDVHLSETGRTLFRGVRFQTPSSVSFSGLTEFRGTSSVSSFQPFICVPIISSQCELKEFLAELTEFAQKLSEFFLPKQYSRNSIPPVS